MSDLAHPTIYLEPRLIAVAAENRATNAPHHRGEVGCTEP